MKNLLLSLALATSCAFGQTYTHHVEAEPSESDAALLKKAASVVPSPRQLAYHQREFLCFIHFGPNTFTGVEWGSGKEDATVFNPSQVDTDQWCQAMQAAGMTQVIITVKHHDGYCTWQTRYNKKFSVHQSPWKDGKGDVLKLLSESCRKYGIKLGVYVSPADLYQIESKDGLYGNLSEYRKSVIPTDPASFKTDPTKVRADKPADAPTFTVEADDYNRYMMNQLYEVLTEYGPIHEVWFDGAHPKRKGGQKYIKPEWFKMIRKLAPEAVIFGGPDIRWCGNEAGRTRDTEWNVLPVASEALSGLDRPQQDLGSDQQILRGKYSVYGKEYPMNFLYYLVPEVNTSIRHGWFWRDNDTQEVRTADDVFDIYERAVGGNGTFLLNIPPGSDGRFGERDVAALKEVGKRIRATYGKNLLSEAEVSVPGLLDGDIASFWQAPSEQSRFTIKLAGPVTLNRFMLQEAISKVGQRVKSHALDAKVDGSWQEVARSTTIGYKRILRFPSVTTSELRVRLLDSRFAPAIAEIGAFFYTQPPLPVTASRSPQGLVSLGLKQAKFTGKGAGFKTQGLNIHFTIDGTEPTRASPQYTEPFPLPTGGMVKASSFSQEQAGEVQNFRFGLLPTKWNASATSEHSEAYAASKAIDGDPATFWHSSWAKGHPEHPISLTIDIGEMAALSAFSYLPRQDRRVPDSMVEAWKVEGSRNGKTWKVLDQGEFGNLLNDPTERYHPLPEPITIRYFRFTSLRGTQNKPYAGAAEIHLFTK